MKPPRLSASSIERYEACPAGFKVDYIEKRAPDSPSMPSMNGTACHAALENYVKDGGHVNGTWTLKDLITSYEKEYWMIMPDGSFLADGRKMLTTWWNRQDWDGRTVVATETKDTFDLSVSSGVVPVTYIWDRCDSLDDGKTIEVVDYKTVQAYVSYEELRHRVQPGLYALAAKLKFPDAEKIVFTLDLLRHHPISTTFTTDELREFYVYLRRMYGRMLADLGERETINKDCGYCVRRPVCGALKKHIDAGGIMAITDMNVLADRRREVADQEKALKVLKGDIDERLIAYCEAHDALGLESNNTIVQVTAKSRSSIDSDRVNSICGTPAYTIWTKEQIEALIGNGTLTPGQQSALRQCIRKTYGNPYIKTSKKLNKNPT